MVSVPTVDALSLPVRGFEVSQASWPPASRVRRIGEASHPGPGSSEHVCLSTSNPSGLRGKESHVMDWGPGIHCLSETQYSVHTQGPAARAFTAMGQQQSRLLRTHAGHPAPLRHQSLWAGAWTGVFTVSDFPSRPVPVVWEPGLYQTGRVQVTQHYLGSSCLTVGNLYGFPKGPTFPDALDRTERLLSAFTKELVLGLSGPRAICGDFNHSAEELEQVAIWKREGWVDAQTVAEVRWGREPVPTCKAATYRDYVFLSPEAAACCSKVEVLHCFQEHATVVVGLATRAFELSLQSWPLPGELPWSQVDVSAWHAAEQLAPLEGRDATDRYRSFASQLECSLDGFVQGSPGGRLPGSCFGRAKRLAPALHVMRNIAPKKSRPGEEEPTHGLLGLELKRWFQQLRRLQSMRHAAHAGKMTAAAISYRVELWGSIRRAKGFHDGFSAWWSRRPVRFQGCPVCFPEAPPPAAVCEAIFQDYRENFKRFEAWNVRRRCQVLCAKHEASRNQLYWELRDSAPPQVDTLTLRHDHSILEVEADSRQVFLETPPDQRGDSLWLLEGTPVEVQFQDEATCIVPGSVPLSVESELVQVQTLSSVSDIHEEFVGLWSSRWLKHSSPSPSDWSRVLDFAKAFILPSPCSLPVLTVSSWRAAVSRFKPRAARGPDGFAKSDLQQMSDGRVEQLLGLLRAVENGTCTWPVQLLVGLVCSLSKQNGKTDAQAFRPIVLFSIVYRTWAGLRARQLLRFLKGLTSADAFGFLPERTASHLWMSLQAAVECACQAGDSLFGFCTDLVKAFNALPRCPLLQTLAQLGVPQWLTSAWRQFLQGVERRFIVRGMVSAAVRSVCGFPEGDPLSTVAMATTNLLFHLYLYHFTPSIRSLSYVDNLAGVAQTAGSLASGWAAVTTFCDIMQVEIDASKTYVWATQAGSRKDLQLLGLPIVEATRELGGMLSFGARVRNGEAVRRCLALDKLWPRLKKSMAPMSYKFGTLASKFWASALHGISGFPLGEQHLAKLRTKAVRALKASCAGSSPQLRLSLACPPESDPGFYQFLTTLTEFQHACIRCPGFEQGWTSFLFRFDGRLFQGPFSKMLQVCAQVGWHWPSAKVFVDDEGVSHGIARLPKEHLRLLALRAWLKLVASKHQHRDTMSGLDGICVDLAWLDRGAMAPLDVARLGALQSGAFMFGAMQAKFDPTKSGLCDVCDCLDTSRHRVCDCPLFETCRRGKEWVCARWDSLPRCLTHHLLAPANPHAPSLRAMLCSLPDSTADFHCLKTSGSHQHLFTDGSCLWGGVSDLAVASWAVVSATTDCTIACGHVPGLAQTIPRAELTAVYAACLWIAEVQQDTTIWCDAKYVCIGLRQLLEGRAVPGHWHNLDLWHSVHAVLEALPAGRISVQHIPSHLNPAACEDAFEDWVAYWNQRADTQAVMANHNRSDIFAEKHSLAVTWFQDMSSCTRALRSIYFGIASCTSGPLPYREDAPDVQEQLELPCSDLLAGVLSDSLMIGWWQCVREGWRLQIPQAFGKALLEWVWTMDEHSEHCFELTWLEIVVLLLREGDGAVQFPARCPSTGLWVPAELVPFRDPHLTAAAQVGLVREVIRFGLRTLGMTSALISGRSCVEIGLIAPSGGIRMGCSVAAVSRARSSLAAFTAGRPIRSSADLARPLRLDF